MQDLLLGSNQNQNQKKTLQTWFTPLPDCDHPILVVHIALAAKNANAARAVCGQEKREKLCSRFLSTNVHSVHYLCAAMFTLGENFSPFSRPRLPPPAVQCELAQRKRKIRQLRNQKSYETKKIMLLITFQMLCM